MIKAGHRSETLAYTPTDWQLLRSCPAPVLLVGEKHWSKTRHVLAAVDLGTRVRPKVALNHRVVEQAVVLADAIGAELRVGYAVPFSPVLRDLDVIDERELRRAGLRRAEGFREALAKRGIEVEPIRVVIGAPEKALVNLAAKTGAAVVVLVASAARSWQGASLETPQKSCCACSRPTSSPSSPERRHRSAGRRLRSLG